MTSISHDRDGHSGDQVAHVRCMCRASRRTAQLLTSYRSTRRARCLTRTHTTSRRRGVEPSAGVRRWRPSSRCRSPPGSRCRHRARGLRAHIGARAARVQIAGNRLGMTSARARTGRPTTRQSRPAAVPAAGSTRRSTDAPPSQRGQQGRPGTGDHRGAGPDRQHPPQDVRHPTAAAGAAAGASAVSASGRCS